MTKPTEHPAYVAFMEAWNGPVDMSEGSRMALEYKEMEVVHAAQGFVEAAPPAEVREALVAWLRPRAEGGPWNGAGGALRVICDPASSPTVSGLRSLIEAGAGSAALIAYLNEHVDAEVEVRDALRMQLWGRRDLADVELDALRGYLKGTPIPVA